MTMGGTTPPAPLTEVRSQLFVHICISSDTLAEKEERNSNEVCPGAGAH